MDQPTHADEQAQEVDNNILLRDLSLTPSMLPSLKKFGRRRRSYRYTSFVGDHVTRELKTGLDNKDVTSLPAAQM